jgi:hypothetical protein
LGILAGAIKNYAAAQGSDVSDMPWGCPQFCVAAVYQKLLSYNIIAFKTF